MYFPALFIIIEVVAAAAPNYCFFGDQRIALVHPLLPAVRCDPATGATVPVVGSVSTPLDVDGDLVDDAPCLISGNLEYPVGTPCGTNDSCSFYRCDGTGLCSIPDELTIQMYTEGGTDIRSMLIMVAGIIGVFALIAVLWMRNKVL
jgi:hypothetical protein